MGLMERVTGFEFLIERTDGARVWVRLQGSGGLIGDGCLASLNHRLETGVGFESALVRVIDDSLKRARMEARTHDAVRVWADHAEPGKRITITPVRCVLACNARRELDRS